MLQNIYNIYHNFKLLLLLFITSVLLKKKKSKNIRFVFLYYDLPRDLPTFTYLFFIGTYLI